MKSRQFCSVCKQYLEMEVVPTGDGDDDGVVWFRCPQCQGFLPKLEGSLGENKGKDAAESENEKSPDETAPEAAAPVAPPETPTPDMPWDSPADMMASREGMGTAPEATAPATPSTPDRTDGDKAPAEPAEPIAEYAAKLAALDPSAAEPYRPWQTYEVGQCVHHLAWEDCGVVVAKEDLPGGRKIIKCYFGEAGVVRLIEQAPR